MTASKVHAPRGSGPAGCPRSPAAKPVTGTTVRPSAQVLDGGLLGLVRWTPRRARAGRGSGLLALALRALAGPTWARGLVSGVALLGTATSAHAASRGPSRGPAPAGAGSRNRGAAAVAHVVLIDVVVGVGVVKLGWRRPTLPSSLKKLKEAELAMRNSRKVRALPDQLRTLVRMPVSP